MENRYWKPYRGSEELQEEDVWNVIKEDREVGLKFDKPKALTTPRSISRRLPGAARMIPWTDKHEHHDSEHPKLVQHSAPVNIPDWSKIYGKSPIRNDDSSSISDHDHVYHDHNGYNVDVHYGEEESDLADDDDDGRLPPHEWLAKKFERSHISSFSVCEGAGRTLKGRDLSRVRNAVLSKTGFI